MSLPPRHEPATVKAAKKFRYGHWAGNPKGNAYCEGRCIHETHDSFTRRFYQCRAKPSPGDLGADGLCGTHRNYRKRHP